jgi:hypothetical protein
VAYRNQLLVCWPRQTKSSPARLRSKVTGIMVHEYMHHAQRELTNDKSFTLPNYYARPKMGPKWMVEGTAEVVQHAWLISRGGAKNPGLGGLVERAGESRKPLRSMREHGSMKSWKEYSVAHLAAQLLADRFGEQAMFNYWRYVGQGRNWESAFKAAFGIGLGDFERQFETLRYDSSKAGAFVHAKS